MSRTFKLLIGLLALLVLPSLSACTSSPMPRAVLQALGRAMSGTAEEVKEDVSGKPEAPAQAKTTPTPEAAPR